MNGKTAGTAFAIVILFFSGIAWGASVVPVSPGGGAAVIGESCPAFSWSAADKATGYRVEVYERLLEETFIRDDMAALAAPVLSREFPVPALSWTPSREACLDRGRSYVWYVSAIAAVGEGQWSAGMPFEVEAAVLSVEQRDAVEQVVREYLASDGFGADTADLAIGTKRIQGPKTVASSVITTMFEGPTNTFYGDTAGAAIDTGTDNTFVGAAAGASNTLGGFNSFFGRQAGFSNTNSVSNSFVGYKAGYGNLTGNHNSLVGAYAGSANTTGHSNSYFGRGAGQFNDGGSGNSFFGYQAGFSNPAGSANVFLGQQAGYSETGSNKLYIDNCFTGGECTEPLIYGEFDNREVRISGSLTMVSAATPSDLRYKKDIHTLESSLEKILKLQGVTYEWDQNTVPGAGYPEGTQIGLIAQEVEKVFPELVHTDSEGFKTLSYDKLTPVLIEAVKEQQKRIGAKDIHIERLQQKLEKQQQTITSLMERLSSLEVSVNAVALR